MSWLNGNDYFVMDAMINARLDDLRSTTEIARVGAVGDDTPRAAAGARPTCCRTIACDARSTLRALDEVRSAP